MTVLENVRRHQGQYQGPFNSVTILLVIEAGSWGQASDEVSERIGLGVGGGTQKPASCNFLLQAALKVAGFRERELCGGVCVCVCV